MRSLHPSIAALTLTLAACSSDSAESPNPSDHVDLGHVAEDMSVAPDLGDKVDAGLDMFSPPDAGQSDLGPDAGDMHQTQETPWRPAPKTSWQWQLIDAIDLSFDVQMYDVDLFDATDQDLAALKARGIVVICYFSAGSFEEWREDKDKFTAQDYKKPLDGWPGERWLDTRSENVRKIMLERLDLAQARGCDGVEPDNVDGYDNDTGFALTAQDQLNYNLFLAQEAHKRGLSVGLKNALGLAAQLEPAFDWALNEECLSFDECALLAPFISANKAVFHVEYVDEEAQGQAAAAQVCAARPEGFSTLIKTWDLTPWRLACP